MKIPMTVIISTFVIDIASKMAVEKFVVTPPYVIPISPHFNVVHSFNRGVSFGLFNSSDPHAPYVLAAFALVIVVGLLIALWRSKLVICTLGYALIVGGALGNVLDRLRDGAVTDFLDFYVDQYHFPTFNFADAFIFCGVITLLVSYTRPSTAKRVFR